MKKMRYIVIVCLCLLATFEVCAQYDYGSPYASKRGIAPVKKERSGAKRLMLSASVESVHSMGTEIPLHGGVKYGAGI